MIATVRSSSSSSRSRSRRRSSNPAARRSLLAATQTLSSPLLPLLLSRSSLRCWMLWKSSRNPRGESRRGWGAIWCRSSAERNRLVGESVFVKTQISIFHFSFFPSLSSLIPLSLSLSHLFTRASSSTSSRPPHPRPRPTPQPCPWLQRQPAAASAGRRPKTTGRARQSPDQTRPRP